MDKDNQAKPPVPADEKTEPEKKADPAAAQPEAEKKPEPVAAKPEAEKKPEPAASAPPVSQDKPTAGAAPAAPETGDPKVSPPKASDPHETVQGAAKPPYLHDTRESPKVTIPERAFSKPGPVSGTEMIGGAMPADLSGHVLDRKGAERRWLESKSKEELVELILELEQKQPGLDVTEKMMKVQLTGPVSSPSDSYKIPDDLSYVRLPVVRKATTDQLAPTWRIVLVSLEQNNKPLGLIIDSEITVGRTAGDATPDLDLTPFGASIKGVSRIHAKIRPSLNSLALIDNNSSNGTYCNRTRIPPNAEQPLKEGDVIAFGQAYFLVRVVKSPDTTGPKTLI